ncbi:hypothetical protein ACHAXS_000083, partial [Conticribra weissflogii]
MEIPQGITSKKGNSKDYVLQLISNFYGQKKTGKVWNQYMVDKLFTAGYTQLLLDECVFYKGSAIFIVYVDDGIFLGPTDLELTQLVKTLQNLGLDIEDQGHPPDYIGVNIKYFKDGSYEFTQQALIEAILDDA